MSTEQANVRTGFNISDGLRKLIPTDKDVLFCWAYAFLITAAEVVVGYRSVKVGMIIHALLLMAVLVHSSMIARPEGSRMMLTLVLAPLTRILSLAMPLGGLPLQYWYAVIGLPILLAAFVVARLNGYKAADIGITAAGIPRQLLVAPLGVILGYVEYMILKPEPLVSLVTWSNVWLPALILLVFTGFAEELVFRGIMYKAFSDGVNAKFSLIYVSLLFSSLHITHLKVLDVFFVLGVALLFTCIRRTGSLVGIVLAHGITNVFLYIAWPNMLNL